jgi:hypothetical protein
MLNFICCLAIERRQFTLFFFFLSFFFSKQLEREKEKGKGKGKIIYSLLNATKLDLISHLSMRPRIEMVLQRRNKFGAK